jgi:SAM-dependent methyltransferase
MQPTLTGSAAPQAPPADPGSWQIGSHPDGWWARERLKFIRQMLGPILQSANRILDSGCGRAGFAREAAGSTRGFAVACDYQAQPEWQNVPGRLAHVVGDATMLPFRDGAFDVSVALDVVEHFPDDQAPLAELRRVTTGAGHVGLTVPALHALWSPFDESVGHYRRYRARDLEQACATADLRPISTTYFFSWLVPPAWLLRNRDRRDADHDRPGGAGRVLDRAIGAVGRVERAWLRHRPLPFGTSLWALAHVNGTSPP